MLSTLISLNICGMVGPANMKNKIRSLVTLICNRTVSLFCFAIFFIFFFSQTGSAANKEKAERRSFSKSGDKDCNRAHN